MGKIQTPAMTVPQARRLIAAQIGMVVSAAVGVHDRGFGIISRAARLHDVC